MPRRQKIKRKRRVFVGCEGESEQGYAALLQRFANEQEAAVYLDTRVATRAGDPLAILQRAIALAEQGERGSKPAYSARFLMLDTDRIGENRDRDNRIQGLANDNGFVLLRQNCCFESFLLRHFAGHGDDNPPTAAIALSRLQAVWPDYRKGLPAQELVKRISVEDVRRTVGNRRDADFSLLFHALGL